MAATKKPKAKAATRAPSTRSPRKTRVTTKTTASSNTALENNGIIVFAILAIIFLVLAVAQST